MISNKELSEQFDTFASSYSLGLPLGLTLTALEFDEYEKSLFLTVALELIIRGLYTGAVTGLALDSDELTREAISKFIRETKVTNSTLLMSTDIETNNISILIPSNVLFIIYESIKVASEDCMNGKYIQVVPVTYDEFHRIKDNPFKGPNKRRALRIDSSSKGLSNNYQRAVKIASVYPFSEYYYRYISRPDPIILVDLPNGMLILGKSEYTECQLDPSLLSMLIQAAVKLAIESRKGKDN